MVYGAIIGSWKEETPNTKKGPETMKYAALYYPDTLEVAMELVCRSYTHNNDRYEFRNVRVLSDSAFGNAPRTTETLECSEADYDVIVMNCILED